jgi:type II secretory pathway pseudopilin PulG
MYKKNNKGITLIVLVITVILLLILSGVGVNVATDSYKNAKVNKFVTQMQLIQEKIDNIDEPGLSGGTTLFSGTNNNIIEQIANIIKEGNPDKLSQYDWNYNVSGKTIYYRVYTKEKIISDLNLDNIDVGTIVVNFETREVVSLDGIEYNGVTYHTQYSLPGGQTIKQKVEGSSLNIYLEEDKNGELVGTYINSYISITGLNAKVSIPTIYYGNGTETATEKAIDPIVKYKLLNKNYLAYGNDASKKTLYYNINNDKDNKNAWKTIAYDSNIGTGSVDISEAGYYVVAITNKDETAIYLEGFYIGLGNSLKGYSVYDRASCVDLLKNYSYEDGEIAAHIYAFVKKDNNTYAWIPRYAYNVNLMPTFSKNSDGTVTTNPTPINKWVEYFKGNSEITTDNQVIKKNNNDGWIIPDQFEEDDTGILVKYDNTKKYPIDEAELDPGLFELVGILIGKQKVTDSNDIIHIKE